MQFNPLLKNFAPPPLAASHFLQKNFRIGKSLIDGNLWILGSPTFDFHWLQFKPLRAPKVFIAIALPFSKMDCWISSLKLSLSPPIQDSFLQFFSSNERDEEKTIESTFSFIQQTGIHNFFSSDRVNQTNIPIPIFENPPRTPSLFSQKIFSNFLTQISELKENKFIQKSLNRETLSAWGGIFMILFLILWFAT